MGVSYILIKIKILINKLYISRKIKLKKSLLNQNSSEEIIVSLTSHPGRYDVLADAIIGIFRQTYLPNRIILYLDDQADISTLPDRIVELRNIGLEICTRPENIKPHKKYYYAMLENPNSIIITVDDDILYNRHLIEELVSCHKRKPMDVIAARAHRILFNDDGSIKPYLCWEWESNKRDELRDDLLATGVGGVLYPPHCLDEKAFDLEAIKKYCRNADDIWLKAMQSLKGTKVYLCDRNIWKKTYCLCREDIGLNAQNCGMNENDKYISNMIKIYCPDCFYKHR